MAMTDEKKRIEVPAYHDHHHSGGHPFAMGVLAGAAVGVGLGMLVAPRKGSELRQQMGTQLTHMKSSCASGFSKAKVKASDWGHKSRDAYDSTRKVVVKSAHETQRYLSDVAGAVTMKSRREGEAPARPDPMKAEHHVKPDMTGSTIRDRTRPSVVVQSS